jgi:hypothetical protein
MITHKKCKGEGKARGHGCGEMVDVRFRKYGLGKKCCYNAWYTYWLLNTEEGKKFREKSLVKAKKQIAKKEKADFQKVKDNAKDWRMLLQLKIQHIARLIDVGLPCLAKQHHPEKIDGGHVFARGGNSTIGLNLHNIHRQGAHSNHFQNDDGLMKEGIVREYGQGYMDFLSEMRQCHALKYAQFEYKEFNTIAIKIVKELQRAGQNFSKDERIEMRNRTNERLGIYESQYCRF